MATEYIKREDALNAIRKSPISNMGTRLFCVDAIADIPSADVVEVIRCRDCVHGEVDDPDFPDQYLCHYTGEDYNKGNFFCAYGERRET